MRLDANYSLLAIKDASIDLFKSMGYIYPIMERIYPESLVLGNEVRVIAPSRSLAPGGLTGKK